MLCIENDEVAGGLLEIERGRIIIANSLLLLLLLLLLFSSGLTVSVQGNETDYDQHIAWQSTRTCVRSLRPTSAYLQIHTKKGVPQEVLVLLLQTLPLSFTDAATVVAKLLIS